MSRICAQHLNQELAMAFSRIVFLRGHLPEKTRGVLLGMAGRHWRLC